MLESLTNILRRNIRLLVSASLILLAMLDLFFLEVTWITLVLIGLAFVPWTIDHIKSASIPGFAEFDPASAASALRRVEGREAPSKQKIEDAISQPITALERLIIGRRDLERELNSILGNDDRVVRPRSLKALAEIARGSGLITSEEFKQILDLARIMNGAVHGETFPEETVKKALDLHLDLLEQLGQRHC